MKLTLVEDSKIHEPAGMIENGLTDIIIFSINKKWDSVRDLNSIIVTLGETNYSEYIPIIEEILEDENNHIGKLQYIVESLNPVTGNIDDGKEEAQTLNATDSIGDYEE